MHAILIRKERRSGQFGAQIVKAILALLALLFTHPAIACQLDAPSGPVSFGTVNSMSVYNGVLKVNSLATGIKCTTILSLLDSSYFGLEIVGPIRPLTHTTQTTNPDTIPVNVAWSDNGSDLTTGIRHMDSQSVILGLIHNSGGKVNLNFRTSASSGVHAGVYKTSVQVKWYYSICAIGGLGGILCVTPSNSLGLERTCLLNLACGSVTEWGNGTAVTIQLELTVKRDCTVSATSVNFNQAALPELIPTATNSVDVRCTAGEAYSVGLSNGQNWDGNTRRMKSVANNYMSYEIWKDALAESRWGEAGAERWPSANASVNGANLNGTVTQLFTYHAKVLATQPSGSAQPAGTYKDTLRVSVDF